MLDLIPLQAIIFDFDGVVAESGEIKTQAFAELYRAYGDAVVTEVVQYHTQNGGLSRYNKFRYYQQHLLNKPPLTPEEEKELDRRFSELVVEAVIAADAVAGATELIRQQAERIPLFVASGTPEIELKVIVERRGLSPYFKQVRGAPKPKKTLIAEILAEHNLKPESVLMIGDAMADYEGAQANGTAFLGRVKPGDENPFPPGTHVVPRFKHTGYMTGNMHSRIKRNVFSNIDTLAHGFADYAVAILSLALEKQQSASLVVPGGNTPRTYLPALAAKPLPWNRVTITLSDERWVDTKSEDSNECLVKKFMLDRLPQKAHFVGLKTWHDTPDEAIPEIDRRLEKITLPFTLTVLGLGEDGHIASLFPGLQLHEPQQNALPSHCLAVYPPISPTPRISLSLDALARSEQIALVVTGHSKRKLLDQLSDNPNRRVPLVWLLQWSQSTITVFETDR